MTVKIKLLICSILSLTLSSRLAAFVRSDMPWLWKDKPVNDHAVLALHPYQRDSLPPRYALYEHGLLDLQGYGELLLREQGLDNALQIVAQRRDKQRVDYRYRLQGHDVCDLTTALTHLHNGGVYQRGRYPRAVWDGSAFVWPARELARQLITAVFAPQVLRIDAVTRCLLATLQGYVPVYDFNVRVGALPYRVRTDGNEVLDVQRQFYDLQGEFHVYPENSERGSKQQFFIDIQERGIMTNERFKAAAISEDGQRTWQLSEPSNIFNYPDTDKRMAQVSAFAHANLMFEWFYEHGFRWYGRDRVVLLVHANYDPIRNIRNPNNAFYAPPLPHGDGTMSTPFIFVGDGDGRSLQNLALDGDVIAHEFGHHVIYQYLPATNGEAGAIHEGLADYFTFARTGNPCLAESICLPGSQMCQRDRCMRFADHGYSWRDLYGFGIHIEGQVLSAMLWDLRTEFALPADEVNRLALNAVRHFTPQTRLRDFIDSLLMADYNLTGGRNCATIIDAALSRGLQNFVSVGIECADGKTAATLIEEAGGGSDSESEVKSEGERARKDSASRSGFTSRQGGCGTILASSSGSPYVLMILLLPLLFCCVRHACVLHRYPHPSNPRTLRGRP